MEGGTEWRAQRKTMTIKGRRDRVKEWRGEGVCVCVGGEGADG